MRDSPITTGAVVLSMAGRDAGRLFIVLDAPDEQYALIADGDLRKVEKPKRKKQKHLRFAHDAPAGLCERLAGGGIQNHQIRAVLDAVRPHEEE